METLLSIGLIAFCAALVTAMHLHLTTRRPTATVTIRPIEPGNAHDVAVVDDIDAEFFRIIEREGLRESNSP